MKRGLRTWLLLIVLAFMPVLAQSPDDAVPMPYDGCAYSRSAAEAEGRLPCPICVTGDYRIIGTP